MKATIALSKNPLPAIDCTFRKSIDVCGYEPLVVITVNEAAVYSGGEVEALGEVTVELTEKEILREIGFAGFIGDIGEEVARVSRNLTTAAINWLNDHDSDLKAEVEEWLIASRVAA